MDGVGVGEVVEIGGGVEEDLTDRGRCAPGGLLEVDGAGSEGEGDVLRAGRPGSAWASRRFLRSCVPGVEVVDPGLDGEEPARRVDSTVKVAGQRSLVRAVRGVECQSSFGGVAVEEATRRRGRGRRRRWRR